MDDGMLLLIIAIVSITIGYLAGSLLSGGRDRDEEKEPTDYHPPQFPSDALHIWRDQNNEHLVLQIGEHAFRSTEPIPPKEHKYITQLLLFLQKWLGIDKKADTVPQQTKQPASQTHQPPQVKQSSTDPIVPEISDILESKMSIVAQVDEILQELLSNSPLKDKGIRLMENIDGSMRFYIGLDSYDDVAAIPDETIKGAIRAAVKEWEQRQ